MTWSWVGAYRVASLIHISFSWISKSFRFVISFDLVHKAKTFSMINLGKLTLKKTPLYYKWARSLTALPARAFFHHFFFFFFPNNAHFQNWKFSTLFHWLNFWTGWPQFKSVETFPRIISRIIFTKRAPQLTYGTLKKFRPRFRKTKIERNLIELITLV